MIMVMMLNDNDDDDNFLTSALIAERRFCEPEIWFLELAKPPATRHPENNKKTGAQKMALQEQK